jgi:hypothetical protein
MTKYYFLILFVYITTFSNAQHDNSEVDVAIQKKWIENTIKELTNNDSLSSFELTHATINSNPGYERTTFRIKGETRIQCGNDWIYFKPHSAHENELVGDLCIAITNGNKIFVNYEHICGGIIHFIKKNDTLPKNAIEFFKTFVSDTNGKEWKELNDFNKLIDKE